MWFGAVVLAALAVLPSPAASGFGSMKVAEHFTEDISRHFLKSTKKSYALRYSRNHEKPLVVILTRKGCGACQNLKQSVNHGTALKASSTSMASSTASAG